MMIAERSSTVERFNETETDLFAGLSFPEVPSAPIEVSSRYIASDNVHPKTDNITVNSSLESTEKIVENAVEPTSRKTVSLSALYTVTTEEFPADSKTLYPDLPNLGVSNGEVEGGGLYSTAFSSSQYDESESLLPKTSSSVKPQLHASVTTSIQSSAYNPLSSSATQAYGGRVVEHRSEGAPELITDLVMENSRLADEVANLRKLLSDQQHDRGVTTENRSANQGVSNVQHQAVAQSSVQSDSVTGVHITDTTRPPEKGVKYVCCGGCRQWLMAPRDAQFVVCSTCEAINNCNLAPKDNTAAHNRENEQRALAQRNANQAAGSFWFLDCLSKGFT